jgi:hypothetical protein
METPGAQQRGRAGRAGVAHPLQRPPHLSGRFHPQFLDTNRRGIGKSQSIWSAHPLPRPPHRLAGARAHVLGDGDGACAGAQEGERQRPTREVRHGLLVRQLLPGAPPHINECTVITG